MIAHQTPPLPPRGPRGPLKIEHALFTVTLTVSNSLKHNFRSHAHCIGNNTLQSLVVWSRVFIPLFVCFWCWRLMFLKFSQVMLYSLSRLAFVWVSFSFYERARYEARWFLEKKYFSRNIQSVYFCMEGSKSAEDGRRWRKWWWFEASHKGSLWTGRYRQGNILNQN